MKIRKTKKAISDQTMLLLLIIILYDDTDNNAWDFQNIKSLDNLEMATSYSLVQKQSSRGVLFQNVFL